MAQIKNGLKGKSVDDKIQYSEQIKTSLTGNPHITIDLAKMTELDTNTSTLLTKKNASDAIRVQSKTATQELNAAEDDLVILFPVEGVHYSLDDNKIGYSIERNNYLIKTTLQTT